MPVDGRDDEGEFSREISASLKRIAAALDRIAPPSLPVPDFTDHNVAAWLWRTGPDRFEAVQAVNRVDLKLLIGIDHARDALLANTCRFACGQPANNALLWGARGMGKSSLVKAIHSEVASSCPALVLIELLKDDLISTARLLRHLRDSEQRFLVFCDDLSFTAEDHGYHMLKPVLEGGVEGRPDNVVFYATSNRRHLMPREMIENERQSAIHPSEASEEKISLSDRFGLWLGFHPCSQNEYLDMLRAYCNDAGIVIADERLRAEATAWQVARGSRSGRIAWQCFMDLASRHQGRGGRSG